MWRLAAFLTAALASAAPRPSPLLLQTHRAGRVQVAKAASRSGLKRKKQPFEESYDIEGDDVSSEEAAQSQVVQQLSGEIEGMRKQLQLLGNAQKVQAVSDDSEEDSQDAEDEQDADEDASADDDESYEADEEEDEAEEEDAEDEAENEEKLEKAVKFNDDPTRFGMYDMEQGHADVLDSKTASKLLQHEKQAREAAGDDDSQGEVLSESEEAEEEDSGDIPEDGSDSHKIFGADQGENEYDPANEMGIAGAFAGEKPDYEGPAEVSGSGGGRDMGGNELDS